MGLVKKIDSSIATALRHDKLSTRPGISPGAWVILLLPLCMLLTCLIHPVSLVYRYCTIYATSLLFNSLLLLYNANQEGSLSVLKSLNCMSFVPIFLTSVLYFYFGLDVYRSVCHSISSSLIFFEAVPFILKVFPRSFSFGEACIVGQATALFVYGTFIRLTMLERPVTGDLNISTTVIQVALVAVLFISLIPKNWSATRQYCAITILLLSVIPVLHLLLGFNAIFWVLEFLFKGRRIRLICCWAVCSGFAWGMVVAQIRSHRKAGTDTRKVFHFLAVAVFLSGIMSDPLLLYFASGLVFPLFLLIEFIRIRRLPPLADALQQGFHVYADEKDVGGIALTPIYLLLGCSAPMWLLPDIVGPSYTLPLLAGVLSIGIGDSCASIIGKHFGRQKWSGSNKTVEGTIACAVGQVTTLLVLTSLGHVLVSSISIFHLAKPILGVCIVSLIEAKTDQIDNLVLPIVTYMLILP